MTLVSIIIPSFRQPQFLGRAIESCLTQSYEELEIVVVDDRGRDSSLGIAQSYALRDARVRVFEAETNGGLGKARNIGIARANGEYLCFLDSDDYLLPDSIRCRLEAIPAASDRYGDALVAVYGDWQHVGEQVDDVSPRQARTTMPVVAADNYTGENVFICSAPLVRRDAVLRAGGFPEGLPMLEDFGLWATMVADGGVFAPVHQVVATYRQRPNSMLRGDGVVLMADYVEVINRWMGSNDVLLADGGAMSAWLRGDAPNSHGRLSWNLPSVLGSFGDAPSASAVLETHRSGESSRARVGDFMTDRTSAGLDAPAVELSTTPTHGEVAVVVRRSAQALAAVAIVQRLRLEGETIRVCVPDPTDWGVSWPLALAGITPASIRKLEPDGPAIDLDDPSHRFADIDDLAAEGASILWGPISDRDGAIVYVPDQLHGYPALDAWVSVALHALADAGLDADLVADPNIRVELSGWRSSVASFNMFRRSTLVISAASVARDVRPFAPVVVFDPSSADDRAAKTASQLRAAIGRGRRT